MNKKIILIKLLLFSFSSLYSLHQPIITIGIPKSGNHLLVKLLCSLTGKKHKGYGTSLSDQQLDEDIIWAGRLPLSEQYINLLQRRDCRVIFIYRDPRDQTVSRAYWARKAERKYYPPEMLNCSLSETITQLISNNLGVINTHDYYNLLLPWVKEDYPFIYVTTFEKLVGSKGGGSDEIQMQEIINIMDHLGIRLSPKRIQEIVDKLFGPTLTFRKGRIGEWKKEFSKEQKRLFKETTGQLLIDLGYEDSFDW